MIVNGLISQYLGRCHSQIPAFDVVFGRAGAYMRLVMLYRDHPQTAFPRPARRGVVGMKIAGHDFGLEPVEPAQVANGRLKCRSRLDRVEIPDVLAHNHLIADRDRHRVFEMPAYR